jgi:hypothetical protein
MNSTGERGPEAPRTTPRVGIDIVNRLTNKKLFKLYKLLF